MRRILSVAIVLGFVGAAMVLAPRPIAGQRASRFDRETINGRDVVARQVLVKFRQSPLASELEQLRADSDADDVRSLGRSGVFRLRSRSMNVAALVERLSRRPGIVYAEPNYIVKIISEPNDPRYPELWALKNIGQVINGVPGVSGADIHAVPAWNITLGSTANVVGVIDTGIDYTHQDLAANMWSAPTAYTVTVGGIPITCAAGTHGFNAITRTCNPMDDQDHGTHVAGTIGAVGDNGTGVVGINWITRLMAIKFIDATGEGTTEDAIASVEFAIAVKQRFAATADANIRVLSNSWGGSDFSQALLDEVNAANTEDMLFVAGAGNDSFDNDVLPFYPASFEAPNVVAVAATDNNDDLAWFSNYGSNSVHVGAPGVDILSTTRGNHYQYLSGTSMATPHVSGTAALILSQCAMSTSDLKETIVGTADTLPTLTGLTTSGGRLNVHSALYSCIAPPQTPTTLTAHGGDTNVMLSWTPALGATRYNVKRSLTSGGPYTPIATGIHGAIYTDTAVVNDTTYYYVVSAQNNQGESGDSNEASATPAIPPDLTIPTFTAPSSSGAGLTVTLSVTTRNQGAGNAAASSTKFYWSSNAILDASDTVFAAQDVPALTPNASSSASISVVIPSVPAGRYYVIAKADADDVLSESVESNNTLSRLITVGPDLTVSALTVPGNGSSDSTIVVNDTTKNLGGGAAQASVTKFYLSSNQIIDAGDTYLGSRDVPSLDVGAAHAASTILTIPASVPAGTYSFIAKADADGVLAETNETNNVLIRTIVIGSDLVVTAIGAPAKSGSAATITITDTTSNQGGGTAPASVTSFYLSTNTVLDAGDTLLTAAHAVPDLPPGASDNGSTSVTLPTVATGNYYLIAKADAHNVVLESRETNNTLSRSILIGPDLIVSTLTVPTSGGSGSTLTISDVTTNQGGGSIGPTTTKFYWSTDSVVDGTDSVIGSRNVPSLNGGAASSGSVVVTVPASAVAGTYYVIASADADSTTTETYETNNATPRSIVIGSDLIVTALGAPTKAGGGSTITVTDTTLNNGGGTAAASATRFYLSANGIVDAADTLLSGMHSVPELSPGTSDNGTTSLVLPAVSAGTYYIIARADDLNGVVESKETNNTLAKTIVIGGDLVMTALTAPATGGAGAPLTINDSTTNQGGGSVGPSVTRFYWSSDSLLDGTDTAIGSRNVASLNAGATSSGSTMVAIAASAAPGTYYIIAKADADDASPETYETNNTIARSIVIGNDLVVSSITAPAKGGAGGSIVVTDTTTNQGGGNAPASVTSFYLSTTTTGNSNDVLLDNTRAVPALAAGGASTGSTTVTIPATTGIGTFYIIAKADSGNAASESVETNNGKSRAISIGPDLTFVSLSLTPISVSAGGALTISDGVTNQGGGVAAASTTRFYLSVNSGLDAGDILLSPGRSVPQLAGNASSSGTTVVTIPAGAVPRVYYVIAQTDSDNVVDETAENNNASTVRTITVNP